MAVFGHRILVSRLARVCLFLGKYGKFLSLFCIVLPKEKFTTFVLRFLASINYKTRTYLVVPPPKNPPASLRKEVKGKHLHHRPWFTPRFLVWKCSAGRRGSQSQCQTPSKNRPRKLDITFLGDPNSDRDGRAGGLGSMAKLRISNSASKLGKQQYRGINLNWEIINPLKTDAENTAAGLAVSMHASL